MPADKVISIRGSLAHGRQRLAAYPLFCIKDECVVFKPVAVLGQDGGEAPEARQLVVAETILLFCDTGWYKTFPRVTQKTCENLTRITTGAGGCANRFVSTIAYNT